jgi:hypothetical protein
MSKLFNEGGFLSAVGKETFAIALDKEIKSLLAKATNETEMRIIGSLIQHRAGELCTSALVNLKNEKK